MKKKRASPRFEPYGRILRAKKSSVLKELGVKVNGLAREERTGDDDLAQQSLDEFVSLRLNGLDYHLLRQVDEALDRIEAGDYGVCQRCEEAIPAKRLDAVPWAKYCVRCQERVGEASREDPQTVALPEGDPAEAW